VDGSATESLLVAIELSAWAVTVEGTAWAGGSLVSQSLPVSSQGRLLGLQRDPGERWMSLCFCDLVCVKSHSVTVTVSQPESLCCSDAKGRKDGSRLSSGRRPEDDKVTSLPRHQVTSRWPQLCALSHCVS
jgi:hypothetical protein